MLEQPKTYEIIKQLSREAKTVHTVISFKQQHLNVTICIWLLRSNVKFKYVHFYWTYRHLIVDWLHLKSLIWVGFHGNKIAEDSCLLIRTVCRPNKHVWQSSSRVKEHNEFQSTGVVAAMQFRPKSCWSRLQNLGLHAGAHRQETIM